MIHLNRHLDRCPLLAVPVLLAALWLQVAQPLLLAGHVASCQADEGCASGCSHDAGQLAAELLLVPSRDDAAAAAHRHDGLHCVLCRVLQLAGKAVATEAGLAAGNDLLALSAAVAAVQDRATTADLTAHGPRAPPSC
jgi:hypothetical protein